MDGAAEVYSPLWVK